MAKVPESVIVDVHRRGHEFVRLHVMTLLLEMTDEQRQEIIGEFCWQCGSKNDAPWCGTCRPDPIDD